MSASGMRIERREDGAWLSGAPKRAGGCGAQPRDLAGRIRALVQEYAGRWADAESPDVRDAIHDCMRWMRHALRDARAGRNAMGRLMMREDAIGQHAGILRQAADEIEAIMHGKEGAK